MTPLNLLMLGPPYVLRRNDNGGSISTDICQNESSEPEWFDYFFSQNVANDDRRRAPKSDITNRRFPVTAKWCAINILFRMVLRLGLSRSYLVLDMAHTGGSTGAPCGFVCHCNH